MYLGPPKHSWSRDRIFKGATKCPGLIPALPSSHRQVEILAYILIVVEYIWKWLNVLHFFLMDDFRKDYIWIWKWLFVNYLHAFLSLICPVLQNQQCRHQSYSGQFGGDFHFPADVGSILGRADEVSLLVFICQQNAVHLLYHEVSTTVTEIVFFSLSVLRVSIIQKC